MFPREVNLYSRRAVGKNFSTPIELHIYFKFSRKSFFKQKEIKIKHNVYANY